MVQRAAATGADEDFLDAAHRGGFGDQLGGVRAGVVYWNDWDAVAMSVLQEIGKQRLSGDIRVESERRLRADGKGDLADEADDESGVFLAGAFHGRRRKPSRTGGGNQELGTIESILGKLFD